MTDAVATDGPPPPVSEGVGVSDRFQRMRVPALPTVLFADASEDYRSMARDALLEGRNVTDMRTVGDGGALLAYLQRTGATRGCGHADAGADRDRRAAARRARQRRADPHAEGRSQDRRIPVVVLGQDDDPETVASFYDAGANTYIVKPVTFLVARAPDEGVHRLLARDCRAAARAARVAPPPPIAPMSVPLPNPLRVLAVSAASRRTHRCGRCCVSAHRPGDDVRAGAQARPHATCTTSRWSTARSSSPHWTACRLGEEMVRLYPQTPVIVLADTPDKAADESAAEAGIADFLIVGGLSTRTGSSTRSATRSPTPRAAAPEGRSEERHALASRAPTTACGTGTSSRPDLLLDALEDDARLPRARDRRDAAASGSAASTPTTARR